MDLWKSLQRPRGTTAIALIPTKCGGLSYDGSTADRVFGTTAATLADQSVWRKHLPTIPAHWVLAVAGHRLESVQAEYDVPPDDGCLAIFCQFRLEQRAWTVCTECVQSAELLTDGY
jgi:hypothetical protein